MKFVKFASSSYDGVANKTVAEYKWANRDHVIYITERGNQTVKSCLLTLTSGKEILVDGDAEWVVAQLDGDYQYGTSNNG